MDEAALARVLALAVKAETAPLLARIAALEARSAIAGPPGPHGPPGDRGQDGAKGPPGPPGTAGDKGLDGRDGKDGRDGVDGTNGRDGVDGVGFPDLEFVTDDIGRLFVKAGHLGARIPSVIDRGVYRQDESYLRGDAVTRDGSLWIAQVDTPKGKPGESESGWRLAVKKGADGKQGPQGPIGERGTKGDKGDPGGRY